MDSFSLRSASAEQRCPSLVVVEDPEADLDPCHLGFAFERRCKQFVLLVLCFFADALSLKVCSLEAARPARVLMGVLGWEYPGPVEQD